ncbi:MAG: hypothetical protein PHH62_03930, partial [Endomicrobiaceae bacterium]|nr:hypothetical protein [Endomicrobiaceae bacterium]
ICIVLLRFKIVFHITFEVKREIFRLLSLQSAIDIWSEAKNFETVLSLKTRKILNEAKDFKSEVYI